MNPLITRYQNRIRIFLIHGALVAGCFFSPATDCRPAFSAEIQLVPSCEFKEEFNDNVFLTADKKSDFITTLAPGVAFSRAAELLNINIFTGLSWHDYAQTEGIGTMDYQYNVQVVNKLTSLDEFGLSATYAQNTRPDSINQSTGLTASTGTDHHQYSANLRRLIDETTAASLTYSFVQDLYDNPASQDNHVHTAGMVISKDLGAVLPLLKGTFSTNFSRAVYRDSNSDNYTLRIGASRNINEKLNINLSVGGQATHSNFVTTSNVSNDSWGAVGSSTLNYSGERTFGSLSFARDFSAASGQVGAVETTSFGVTLGRGITDKSTAQIAASYNINQASSGQFSTRSIDDRAFSLKADIAYKISKYFDIGLQYAYYSVTYGFSDVLINKNSVMLRLAAKYPATR